MSAHPEAGGGGRSVGEAELAEFICAVLRTVDLDPDDAALVGRLMAAADARGADAHGVFRLPQYVRRIQSGGINRRPRVRIVESHPSAALIDGDNGMGHLVMSRAADLAIEMARSAGVGWVGVRHSNHAGPAALYATMPLAHDMIGLYLAIGNANHMAPWGGVELLLSTNPIAIAVPAGEHPPVVLDMATTNVAYGKVKKTAQLGTQMPEGWMIDRSGRPLTDPARAGEGSLLPIGGFKGYGLALMIGLLAGVLNGAAFGSQVVDFNADPETVTNTGHAMVAIDVARFTDVAAFKARVDAACEEIKSSAPMPGAEPIRIPGEGAAARLAASARSGIALSAPLVEQLDRLAASLGCAPLRAGLRPAVPLEGT